LKSPGLRALKQLQDQRVITRHTQAFTFVYFRVGMDCFIGNKGAWKRFRQAATTSIFLSYQSINHGKCL